jgi:hypothetical protein
VRTAIITWPHFTFETTTMSVVTAVRTASITWPHTSNSR